MRGKRTNCENVNPLSEAQSSNQLKVRADLALKTIKQPINNHTSSTTWVVDIDNIVDIPFIDEESDENINLAQT